MSAYMMEEIDVTSLDSNAETYDGRSTTSDGSSPPCSPRSPGGGKMCRARGEKTDDPEIQELRLKVNSRERRRMHDLNSALDGLREVMPYANGPSVRKLSKIATLLLAKNYILMLNNSLDEMKKLVSDIYQNQPGRVPGHPAAQPRMVPPPQLPSLHGAAPPGGFAPGLHASFLASSLASPHTGTALHAPALPTTLSIGTSGLALHGLPGAGTPLSAGAKSPLTAGRHHSPTATAEPTTGLPKPGSPPTSSPSSVTPTPSSRASPPHPHHHHHPAAAHPGFLALHGWPGGPPCSCVQCHTPSLHLPHYQSPISGLRMATSVSTR